MHSIFYRSFSRARDREITGSFPRTGPYQYSAGSRPWDKGGGHLHPQIRRGRRSPKQISSALGASKIKVGGGGAGPLGLLPWIRHCNTEGPKTTEKWRYRLCLANSETLTWLRWPRWTVVPSPLGDVNIAFWINTFVLNTLTLVLH